MISDPRFALETQRENIKGERGNLARCTGWSSCNRHVIEPYPRTRLELENTDEIRLMRSQFGTYWNINQPYVCVIQYLITRMMETKVMK
jgi:hypothetical protein